jgi:hypothetical protein
MAPIVFSPMIKFPSFFEYGMRNIGEITGKNELLRRKRKFKSVKTLFLYRKIREEQKKK